MITDWINLYKVRIANSIKAMEKHEVVKLLVVMKLLEKHKKEKNWIRIYTEFPIDEGKKTDIYYENIRTKEAYAFEIQKDVSSTWLDYTKSIYSDWMPYGCNTSDLIIINLNLLSNDLNKLSEELDKFII